MKYETGRHINRFKPGTYLLCACTFVFLFFPQGAQIQAEDWATYMHDNARSGVTSETLDISQLRPSWVYTSPAPPRTAFSGPSPWDPWRRHSPLPANRDFDSAFFVTVVGDSVYLGSSVTDSVHCLDINNGSEKWFYRTNGAVRFPPAHYNGKLYFGSDDGYVYCINASTGSLVWKYSPSGDTRLLGNNKNLIPQWPIRTGTAVDGGKVYFAACLVPWENPYLCSVEAETGSDSGTGLYKNTLNTSAAPYSENILSPMGAILLSSTKIYLSQGRAAPHVFSRTTGSNLGIIYYSEPKSIIGWQVNWSAVGTYALLTPDSHLIHGRGRLYSEDDTLFEFNADTRDYIAIHDSATAMIVSDSYSYTIERSFDTDPLEGYLLDIHGTVKCILRSNGSTQWSKSNLDYNPYVLIKAGDNIFIGGTERVVAYNISNGNEVWSKAVDGKVRGLAAANGHLFVSTDTGHIYTFGGSPYDLSGDGKVDIDDFSFFVEAYLNCTKPTDDTCQPYQL